MRLRFFKNNSLLYKNMYDDIILQNESIQKYPRDDIIEFIFYYVFICLNSVCSALQLITNRNIKIAVRFW